MHEMKQQDANYQNIPQTQTINILRPEYGAQNLYSNVLEPQKYCLKELNWHTFTQFSKTEKYINALKAAN